MSRQVLHMQAVATALLLISECVSIEAQSTTSLTGFSNFSKTITSKTVTTMIMSTPTSSVDMESTVTISSSSPMPTVSGSGGRLDVLPIAVGSAIGAVAILAITVALVILCVVVIAKKKKRNRQKSISLQEQNKSEEGLMEPLPVPVAGDVCGGNVHAGEEESKAPIATVDDTAKNKRTSKISRSSKTSKTSKTSKVSQNSKASKNSKESQAPSSNASNVNYDYASDRSETKSPGSRSQCSLPSGMEINNRNRLSNECSYEYAYATTSMDRISSSTSNSSMKSPPKRALTGSSRMHSLRKDNTVVIYMAPAMDENSLYAQFAEIRVRCLQREKIEITDMIGSGQFGKVHQGRWTSPKGEGKVDVALKTLKEGAGEQDKVKFLQEAAIMGQFSHPNVVKLHGVVTEGEPMMIVLELLPKGDLRNYLFSLRNKDEEGDEHTLLSFCRQIVAGMNYLSSLSFIHRDLAARNILVSEDGICKIADFGMSRDLMDENYYISHGGKIPVKWTAPEALHFKKFSTASDVWSYGCVMYEIWSLGHKPYESWSNNQTILEVDEGIRLAPPPGCPRTVYEIAVECWHPETSKRPTFTDIMQRLSLPDTKLLKWSEEDKATDPEAAILGADLDAGLNLYKDLQQRYLYQKSTDREMPSNEVDVAAASYDDPLSVTFAEDKSDPLSRVDLPTGQNLSNDCFLLQPKENTKVYDLGLGAHSYEDPILLNLLEDKNVNVPDV